MSLKDKIAARGIPELFGNSKVTSEEDFQVWREKTKILLQEQEYGYIPPRPDHLRVETVDVKDNFCAGRARLESLIMTCTVGDEEISFPFFAAVPKRATEKNKLPAFVLLNFTNAVPDRYLPAEEIIDSGFAVFSFGYKDVTADENEFLSGVAKTLCPSRKAHNAPGKIAIWSWAAMRVMDYVCSLNVIDLGNVAIVGHSRLGKTALLTGGFDERFKYVISNDSGCSGAALTRGKIGESVERICEVFPHWFCPGYVSTAENGEVNSLPFDQHYLLALSVPRILMIGSAEEDQWADPQSEFLSLVAANDAYRVFGMKGLVHNDAVPEPKSILDEGDALYQFRHGTHYFSREDWQAYMAFIHKQMNK